MNLSDIDWDLNNAGQWPTAIKGVAIALCVVLTIGLWIYFDTQDQLVELEKVEKEEVELRAEFERKQKKAANLEAYKQQLAEMEESFGAMLRQLPNKTEVAELLVDVSQTGLASGLEFELFKPQAEVPKDFYAELPISVRVVGDYLEFGNFVSGLASLPRIVTVHDVKIDPIKGGQSLKMAATVKTYRYLDEEGN